MRQDVWEKEKTNEQASKPIHYIYNRREYYISQFTEEEKIEPGYTSSTAECAGTSLEVDSGTTTSLSDGMEHSKERNSLQWEEFKQCFLSALHRRWDF